MAAIVSSASRAYGERALDVDELGQLQDTVQAPGSRYEYTTDPANDAALDLERSQADGAEDEELLDVPLCTETQLTFTLPPAPDGGGSYHLRYRVFVDAEEKQEWTNPLVYCDGIFFSPVLKGHKAKLQLAPPVVLKAAWEEKHISAKWRWQSQCHHPQAHEGELRLFTIAGLVLRIAIYMPSFSTFSIENAEMMENCP